MEIKYQESAIHAKDYLMHALGELITEEAENICKEQKRGLVTSDDMTRAFLIVLINKGSRLIQDTMSEEK